MNINDVANTLNSSLLTYQLQQTATQRQPQQAAGTRETAEPAVQTTAATQTAAPDQTPAQNTAPVESRQLQTNIRQIQLQQQTATTQAATTANGQETATQPIEPAPAEPAGAAAPQTQTTADQQTQTAIPIAYQTGAAQESQNPLVNLLG